LMATTSYPDTAAKNKGKMVAVQPEISDIASLKPTDSNKVIEVIVYRKWISKHVHSRQPIRFCCILLDRQGTPIQANMDAQDTNYFDHLLQLHSAYRITGFSCEQTASWERTLDNPTSLTFGKFITVQEIPNDNFPEHYFNFISYNELPTKLNVRNPVLTDYIGRVQAVSRLDTLGNATTNRTHRRIIDIQNLSGNIIRLTLWHEMALNFNVTEYEAMEKPIVIAVSSCWVKQFNGLQLSGTSATHYYLNPNIPETYHIKQQCQQLNDATPILNIDNQRYEDLEEEKNRNRFPLATLLEVDPQNYQHVRFTSDAIIYKISTQNKWYYERCTACGKQVIPGNPVPTCKNHGPQPTPTHSYCFKAIIGDGSGTIPITCFSNQANALVKDCNELLTELSTRNPYELPSILKDLEGTARIFQFHFEINSTSKRKDFVLDKVFEKTMLPLPAPPIQNATVKHITTEQPKPVALLETSSPTLSTTGSNNLQENITDPLQQSPTTRPPPEHSTKDQEENEPTDLPALVTKETTYNVNLRADMPKFNTQEALQSPHRNSASQSTPLK
ncbi:nucleic acid-binding, OB-fold protein, partial [Tanacetum coccineum]